MLLARPKRPVDRRFSMRDAMIVVAALAIAFAILRPMQNGPLRPLPRWTVYLAYYLVGLMALTPAVLILRLIGPRPPLHRLTRQPGFAASVAGSTILTLGLLTFGFVALIRFVKSDLGIASSAAPGPGSDPLWWAGIFLLFGPLVGPAVVSTWVMLALSGRRRPVRSWLDYLGRGIGIAWITLFVIDACALLSRLIE